MTSEEICKMSAVTIATKIKEKALSPTQVVDAVLDRIERLDPSLNAFCTPTPEVAREDARNVEAAIMAGEELGPLAGVPISIKDLICTKGIRTVGGSAAYEQFVPDADDVVVERVKAAGAICLGKTNVPEFGYSAVGHNGVFPTTRNPWDLERTPGGSSAGCGAAVAAGMGPLSLGSDGGGSVRIPAAHCGLVGMKASWGRVPLYPGCRDPRFPGFSSWESLEHIGPITRTVADAALLLSVIAGPDPRDRHSIPSADVDWTGTQAGPGRRLRVAFSPDLGYVAVDPEVRSVVEAAVKDLEAELDWDVEQQDPSWEDPFAAFWGVVAMDSDLVGMRELARANPDRTTPHLKAFLERPWAAEDFTGASLARKSIANAMASFMSGYDLLITPTLSVPPFPLHMQGPEKVDGRFVDPFAWLSFTLPFNLTGNPAVSIPAGWTAQGLPVGLQIVGRHLADAEVLSAAASAEGVLDWSSRWPALVGE